MSALSQVLQESSLDLFAVEFSLDGLAEFHDKFRGMKDAFARAMDTYRALVEMRRREPRLKLHAISTATETNLDEIRRLTEFLFHECPEIEHHNLALIRGDRKNPSLQGPTLAAYQDLYRFMRELWAPREAYRYGASVEPMLQWAKMRTAREQKQIVPCRAGLLSGVVYSNGDVSVCETHPPIGNIRTTSFPEIWRSAAARDVRRAIRDKACYCTNEVFLWPSINFQPLQLVRTMQINHEADSLSASAATLAGAAAARSILDADARRSPTVQRKTSPVAVSIHNSFAWNSGSKPGSSQVYRLAVRPRMSAVPPDLDFRHHRARVPSPSWSTKGGIAASFTAL